VEGGACLLPGETGRVITDTIYDTRGLEVQKNGGYSAEGRPGVALFKSTGGDAAIPSRTVNTYDGAGRATKVEQWSASKALWNTSTEHRGDSTVVTPPKGGIKTATYVDARGQTTKLTQYGTAPGQESTTRYEYNKAGKLARLIDPVGNEWTYTHDVRGRLVETVDSDKGRIVETYDDADQLKSRTDAHDRKIFFAYDELGRKLDTRLGEQDGTKLAEWTYDTVLDASGLPVKGQVATSTRFVDGAAYRSTIGAYDVGYRPTEQKLSIPDKEAGVAGEYRSSSRYNVDGSLASETLPEVAGLPAEEVQYGYDEHGMLSTVTSSQGTYVGFTRYTPFGEVEMVRRGLEGQETWTRNAYDVATRSIRESAVEHRKSDAIQAHLKYEYDPAGNVTQAANVTQSETAGAAPIRDLQCFGYDHLQRMTEAWTTTAQTCTATAGQQLGGPATYWTSYAYDVIGNRTQETLHGIGVADTVRKSAYPPAKQLRPHAPISLTVTGPAGSKSSTLEYSPTGSTIKRPGPAAVDQTMTWDDEDKLQSTSAGTGYVYSPTGDKLVSRDDKAVRLTLGNDEIRWDRATKTLSGTRLYKHSAAGVIGTKTAGKLDWLSQDRNGSDVVAVSSSFKVSHRRLDPFGIERATTPDWPANRGFVGGAKEASTGLTTLGAREYDPAAGKFLSADPVLNLGDPAQHNAYSYANNSPATMNDADGMIPKSCPDGDCRAVGGIGAPSRPENNNIRERTCKERGTCEQARYKAPDKKKAQANPKQKSAAMTKLLGEQWPKEITPETGGACVSSGLVALVYQNTWSGCVVWDAEGIGVLGQEKEGFRIGLGIPVDVGGKVWSKTIDELSKGSNGQYINYNGIEYGINEDSTMVTSISKNVQLNRYCACQQFAPQYGKSYTQATRLTTWEELGTLQTRTQVKAAVALGGMVGTASQWAPYLNPSTWFK
jgi:RHS repeat-associated protein